MKLEFISAGVIVNAHGVHGEVKLLPQSEDFLHILKACKTFYIDGHPISPTARRMHKNCLLVKLPGIDTMDAALLLKNKAVLVRRRDVQPPSCGYFDEELIGMTARNAETGEILGSVDEVLDYPAHKIYAIRGGKDEYFTPAVPAFIKAVDVPSGIIDIHVWKGMGSHED